MSIRELLSRIYRPGYRPQLDDTMELAAALVDLDTRLAAIESDSTDDDAAYLARECRAIVGVA